MNAPASINQIAGRQVEMTIRGDRDFTFSFDCIDSTATQKIVSFFKGSAKVEVETDIECGTFIYITA